MKTTYLNKNNTPIIRKCGNCTHFRLIENPNSDLGYCKVMQLHFAFTHEKSVYALVKDFYVCEDHRLENEDVLETQSEKVELLPYLLERNSRKKS